MRTYVGEGGGGGGEEDEKTFVPCSHFIPSGPCQRYSEI